MTASPSEVYAVAAVVWDQSLHSEADIEFLDAIAKADRAWVDTLNSAKLTWKGDFKVWDAVKRLATRERDQQLARALAELEASEFPEFMAEAAE